jgi:hypothetical protein
MWSLARYTFGAGRGGRPFGEARRMSALRAQTHGATVPRWRLVPVQDQRPQRRALQAVHALREPACELPLWGTPRYSACTSHRRASHVFVAAGAKPVGTALARLHETVPPDLDWTNPADLALLRRGYDVGMLRLVKLAAQQAIGGKPQRLSSISLTPLPHLPGELLVRSSSGWTGRARAWVQEHYLLALAWEN